MIFWLFIILMLALVLWLFWRALYSSELSLEGAEQFDATIYKDQLEEVTRNIETGVLSNKDGEEARAEIARRLLRLKRDTVNESEHKADNVSGGMRSSKVRSFLVLATLSCLSLPLYWFMGSPNLPAHPHISRQGPIKGAKDLENRSRPELIVLIEKQIKKLPDDVRGYDLIAPLYVMERRYDDALNAYALAMKKGGVSDKRLTGIAKSLTFKNNGQVPERAFGLVQKLVARNAKNIDAVELLATAFDQRKQFQNAIDTYEKLATLPNVNQQLVRQRIRRLRAQLNTGEKKQ